MRAKPYRKWLSLLVVIPILLIFSSDFVAQIRRTSAKEVWNNRVKSLIVPGMSKTDAEEALHKLGLASLWIEVSHQINSSPGIQFDGFLCDYSLLIEIHLDVDNNVKSAEVRDINSAWM